MTKIKELTKVLMPVLIIILSGIIAALMEEYNVDPRYIYAVGLLGGSVAIGLLK
jgi:predicted peptidase